MTGIIPGTRNQQSTLRWRWTALSLHSVSKTPVRSLTRCPRSNRRCWWHRTLKISTNLLDSVDFFTSVWDTVCAYVGDFKTTDESDENFSLESMLTRWITLYNMDSKYSIRSIFFVEMSSMISVTLFSRPISCRASSSVRFLFITTGRISLMISLICRFTTSLPDTKAVSPIPWPVLEVCFL